MAGELGVAARQAIPLEILVTEADVRRVEDALRVKLPSDYRHLLLHFPVRYSAGTTNENLWDNADRLIARNQELKVGRKSLGVVYQPVPDHFFFIGDDGGGWQFLIDLRAEPSIVHIMEYERVDQIQPSLAEDGIPETLNDWLHRQLLELKHEGIDINSPTPPKSEMGWGCILLAIGLCLTAALAIAVMMLGLNSLLGR